MNSRQRVSAALNHRKPDKCPVDFGATPVTGIAAGLVYRLRQHFKLADLPVRVSDPYQMLGDVDEELGNLLQTDVVTIIQRHNLLGLENKDWKSWRTFDGTPVLVPGQFNTEPDNKGDILMYAGGDKSYPPNAVMPKGGFYFDAIIRQKPIDEDNLDVNDNLEEFTLLDDESLRLIESQINHLFCNTEKAIVSSPGTSALGDIALVPGPMLKDPKGIRDIEEWYVSTLTRKDYLKELFDRQTDIALQNFKLFRQAVGDKITAIYLCGNDFGTQRAPMCSVELFRELYLPYYQKMTEWIHRNTPWKVFKHSCGSIEPLIGSFIDAGFDILNPVQCSAENMDPQLLKDKYGKQIVFWGGGIDTQKTLPFGTPEEIMDEVKNRIRIFNQEGGFVFSTVHNAQANIPVGNFVSMLNALNKYR